MTDFDIVHDRSQSASLKWDKKSLERDFGRTDLLPFHVADMEFRSPQAVTPWLDDRSVASFLRPQCDEFARDPDQYAFGRGRWCDRSAAGVLRVPALYQVQQKGEDEKPVALGRVNLPDGFR